MTIKRALTLALIIAISVVTTAVAKKEKSLIFDPSTAKPLKVDKGWKEQFISRGYAGIWCGNNHLFAGGKKLMERDINSNKIKPLPSKKGSSYLVECLPNGSYVFLEHELPYNKKVRKYTTMDILHRESMKIVKTIIIPITPYYYFDFISPDGKYMASFNDEKIVLDKDHTITLLPIFDLKLKPVGLAWSEDSKKLYIHPWQTSKKRHIIEYDIASRGIRKMVFHLADQEARVTMFLNKLYSGKTGLYFQAGIENPEDPEVESEDVYKISWRSLKNSKKLIKAELIMKHVDGFDINQNGDMVFTFMTSELKHPEKWHGIYFMEAGSKKVKRLTSGAFDQWPDISNDGKSVRFRKSDGNEVSYANDFSINILRRK